MAAMELTKRLFRATLGHTVVPGMPPEEFTRGELALQKMARELGQNPDNFCPECFGPRTACLHSNSLAVPVGPPPGVPRSLRYPPGTED
jgi:hypothetical protein